LPWLPVALSVLVWIWGGSWLLSKIDSKVKAVTDDISAIKKDLKDRQENFEKEMKRKQEEFENKVERIVLPECQRAFQNINKSLGKMEKDVANLDGKLDGILAVVSKASHQDSKK